MTEYEILGKVHKHKPVAAYSGKFRFVILGFSHTKKAALVRAKLYDHKVNNDKGHIGFAWLLRKTKKDRVFKKYMYASLWRSS